MRDLEKQLRNAVKTGKYVVGRKEVRQSLRGTKILVWSAPADLPVDILNQSKTLGIPALRFNGNPMQLGRACGIPYKVSIIAVKSTGDSDFAAFTTPADYDPGSDVPSLSPAMPITAQSRIGQLADDSKPTSEKVTISAQADKKDLKRTTDASARPQSQTMLREKTKTKKSKAQSTKTTDDDENEAKKAKTNREDAFEIRIP